MSRTKKPKERGSRRKTPSKQKKQAGYSTSTRSSSVKSEPTEDSHTIKQGFQNRCCSISSAYASSQEKLIRYSTRNTSSTSQEELVEYSSSAEQHESLTTSSTLSDPNKKESTDEGHHKHNNPMSGYTVIYCPPMGYNYYPLLRAYSYTHPLEAYNHTPSSREFIKVRRQIEPYWHIFNLVLEHEPRYCVEHFYTSVEPLIVNEVEILSLGRRRVAYGPYIHTPWTAPALQKASSKFNHCDFSIRIFLHILEPLFARMDATITWFAVEAKPRLLLHLENTLPQPDIRHSVFKITTRSGHEYIADFTIEQFGFPHDWWLMPRRRYEQRCTTRMWMPQPSAREVEGARRGVVVDWHEKAQVMRTVCHMVNPYKCEVMSRTTMKQWLEVLVKNVCWQTWHRMVDYPWL